METPFEFEEYEPDSANLKNAVIVKNYFNFEWSSKNHVLAKYEDIINFSRSNVRGDHHCVMCGRRKSSGCVIPSQNKDVCKLCDSAFWLHRKLNIVLKFCKGCKNFVTLNEFSEKPDASKCTKCRERGRTNYISRKNILSGQGIEEQRNKKRSIIEQQPSSNLYNIEMISPSSSEFSNTSVVHIIHDDPQTTESCKQITPNISNLNGHRDIDPSFIPLSLSDNTSIKKSFTDPSTTFQNFIKVPISGVNVIKSSSSDSFSPTDTSPCSNTLPIFQQSNSFNQIISLENGNITTDFLSPPLQTRKYQRSGSITTNVSAKKHTIENIEENLLNSSYVKDLSKKFIVPTILTRKRKLST